jgi:hypothetical protein
MSFQTPLSFISRSRESLVIPSTVSTE